jgi:hypothetical protein
MADSDTGEGADLSHREGGPLSDLVASKLRRPLTRPGTITRSLLIERLRRENSRPVVSVVAPAGYGKTTLLSQWAERNGQAFAWVAVDENDNDPKVLLTYVAEALDAVQPVGARVFDALTSPAGSVPGSVVPRLGRAFSSMTAPVALVLDDVHLLRNRECQAALSVLADHVPGGSRMVLAGRSQPPLRIARLRAEGRILEIGAGGLSLTREEASSLLAAADVALGGEDLAELHKRTEGWAAGLYLAALYLREGGSLVGAAVAFGGDDRFVTEYVESEFLARIPQGQRAFLTRTAVLERMCGSLCEAVLARPGAGAALTGLARSNLLLVPLDRRGQWYRYHHLFRDTLLAELGRTEPGLVPALQRRAAAWCLRNGLPEEALEYSIAAGDVGTAGHLVEGLMLPAYRRGRVATLQRWLWWLDDRDAIGGHPMTAVWPPSSPRGRDGRPTPSGGPMRSTAGSTGTRAGRMTWPPGPGPPCCGPCCAAAGPSRCAPTRTRPRAGSRRRGSWRQRRRFFKGSPASCAGTPRPVRCSSRMRSASGTSARLMPSRWRCVNGRCWLWAAVTGAGPGTWPGRHAPCCAGPGWKTATSPPWSARCKLAPRGTGETSQRRGSSWSPLSGCGRC